MKRLLDVATVLLLVVSVALLYRSFRDQPSSLAPPSVNEMERALEGLKFLPISVHKIGREEAEPLVVTGALPSLIVAFRVTCAACDASRDAWITLGSGFPGSVVALSPDPQPPPPDYFGDVDIAVAQVVDWPQFTDEVPIRAVPTTLLVGADGLILRAWVGRISEDRLAHIQESFSVLMALDR